MKVFITGGTGFLGSYLTIRLLQKGEKVVVFDAFPNTSLMGESAKDVEIIKGNLLDRESFERTVRECKPEVIVHLAAYRNTESQEKPMGAFKLNCEGTMNVLEAGRLLHIRRTIYASSVAVYGSPNYYRSMKLDPFRVTENYPPNPPNVYGTTKLFNEGMAKQYHDLYRMDTIGLRFALIYGQGKKAGSRTSVYNDLIEGPLRGESITIDSFKEQVINILYVKDAAYALECACYAASPRHLVFNAGGSLCTTRQLVNAVLEILPQAQLTVKETDQERTIASGIDSTLAKEELGYEAQYNLKKSILDHQRSFASLEKIVNG